MIVYILIVFGFLMRLMPHMPNFVPIAAIALFAGAHLDKRVAVWVPLVIMIISDLVIGLHGVIFYTWGAFILIGFIGMHLKERKTVGNIFASTVFSAVLFFLITNFGVWLAWYPHSWEGFLACFIKAIPFFRNTLAGNLVFSAVLFGSYELARRFITGKKYRAVLLTE